MNYTTEQILEGYHPSTFMRRLTDELLEAEARVLGLTKLIDELSEREFIATAGTKPGGTFLYLEDDGTETKYVLSHFWHTEAFAKSFTVKKKLRKEYAVFPFNCLQRIKPDPNRQHFTKSQIEGKVK